MKRLFLLIMLFLITVLAFVKCQKRTEKTIYNLEIENVTIESTSELEITARYSYPAKLEYVNVYVSLNSFMGQPVVVKAEVGDDYFKASFSNLLENTKYYYMFEYSNGVNLIKTDIHDFETDIFLPVVLTSEVTCINYASAICGGNVIYNGTFNVTARGVCWSTNENPTIDDYHTVDGSETGSFTSNLTYLNSNTTYYVRAYVKNQAGIAYGQQKTFTTSLFPVLGGVINGIYSVGPATRVCFSNGNLQYQASTNTWRFAEHQCDYIGTNNTYVSPTYDGWIDLFGWGTGDNPINTSENYEDYSNFTDWGTNPISNGGNVSFECRTLTKDEWNYIVNDRTTASGIRYAKAQVNGKNGMVLLPDNWNSNTYNLTKTNLEYAAYTSNIISALDWSDLLEANGAVFLPAAGLRYVTNIANVGSYGDYWSASYNGTSSAYSLSFGNGFLNASYNVNRSVGRSVRLVFPIDN